MLPRDVIIVFSLTFTVHFITCSAEVRSCVLLTERASEIVSMIAVSHYGFFLGLIIFNAVVTEGLSVSVEDENGLSNLRPGEIVSTSVTCEFQLLPQFMNRIARTLHLEH
jgi:hypothetical protein